MEDSQKRVLLLVVKVNRESMISVMDDIVEEDQGRVNRRSTRNTYYERERDYELPEPTVEDSNLTDDYMTEIRKSRLLNSQLNVRDPLNEKRKSEPKTLISNVQIPSVTRKSRNFTTSTKGCRYCLCIQQRNHTVI